MNKGLGEIVYGIGKRVYGAALLQDAGTHQDPDPRPGWQIRSKYHAKCQHGTVKTALLSLSFP
ncbi:MAG TPA: hypothetical protein VHU84_18355 [Lacipirellulaceae bacterium]|nr:hypothetical protein [Lacipirellulaceae bacterium]